MRTKTEARAKKPTTFYGVTVGTVVDVNDPQQQGRIRVLCPALGDRPEQAVKHILWCSYVAPFGGMMSTGTRGPERVASEGPVSYGMWAIPKVGSYAFVMCLDGNPQYRVWVGSLYGQFLPHTMPNGRWFDANTEGPLTSTEKPLEPLHTNIREAFGDPIESYEARSRAGENQVSAVDYELIDEVASSRPDQKEDEFNDRKGYQHSRQRADLHFSATKGNFDSQIYSITTPGMHSFTMDDSLKNGRVKIRSTSGNQIILDDTNERIYISTPEGKNWIEMDRKGNIDIHSSRRISVHSDSDINLTANETIRMAAKNIHMRTSEDIRMTANSRLGMYSSSTLIIETENDLSMRSVNMFLNASNNVNILSTSNTKIQSLNSRVHMSGELGINISAIGTGGNINLNADTTGGSIQLLSDGTSGTIAFDASLVLTNTGAALGTPIAITPDQGATTSGAQTMAFTTNRVPLHEPWGRTMISKSTTGDNTPGSLSDISSVLAVTKDSSILELSYHDVFNGVVEYGEDLGRNSFWRR